MSTAHEAEQALRAAGLDILPPSAIDAYNLARNDGGMPNPEVVLGDWEAHTGYLKKHFYVADPSGESAGLLRTAVFLETEAGGELVIEDENGKELPKDDDHDCSP